MDDKLKIAAASAVKVSRGEFSIVLLLLALYFAVNYCTIQWYPFIGIDEVSYSDPAVNWYLGNGFTTTAWGSQPKEQTFASNAPGHPLMLCAWIEVFGFSVASVRMLNVSYCTAAAFLLWLSAVRGAWLKTPFCRIMLAPFLIAAPIFVTTARLGRPDAIALLWVAAAMFVTTFESPRRRGAGFFLLGMLLPVVGLQLGPLAAVLVLVAWIAFGWKKILRDVLFLAAGILIGFALLLLVLYFHGVAYVFLTSTIASKHTTVGTIAQSILLKSDPAANNVERPGFLLLLFRIYTGDYCYLLFSILLAMYACVQGKRGKLTVASPVVIGLLAGLLIPICLLIAGKFPFYYGWMSFLPMYLGFLAALDQCLLARKRWIPAVGVAVIAAAATYTLLPITLQVWLNKSMYDYAPIHEVVNRNVRPDDVVLSDWASYYAVKPLVKRIYMGGINTDSPDKITGYSGGKLYPEMRKDEKDSISLLIIRPEILDPLCKRLGGKWKEIDPGYRAGEFQSSQWVQTLLNVKKGIWFHPYHFELRAYRRAGDGN